MKIKIKFGNLKIAKEETIYVLRESWKTIQKVGMILKQKYEIY